MRILVADDEPIEREALRFLVQHHLPEVQVVGEAGTGRQAVEMAEALRPDVILMDIEMPGLSGLEALREIQERHPEIRSLIVSAHDYFHFAREALRLGAVDYLLKPVKRDQMVEVLNRLKREIAQERQRRQDELVRKEHLRSLRPLAEAELVSLLERGEETNRTRDLLELLGLRFEAGICMVLGDGESSPDLVDAYHYLGSLAPSLCSCALGAWAGDRATVMIQFDPQADEHRTRLWASALARRLRDRVNEQVGVRFRMGMGEPCRGWQELGRSFREALAALRIEGASDRSDSRPTPGALRAVDLGKRYIEAHYAEEITLERVAQEVALTPIYFSKTFSRVAGQTMMDYLTTVRVECAKQLLADPQVSIKEACFTVGYNDPNYFSRVFKKVTGQAPTEFREGRGDLR